MVFVGGGAADSAFPLQTTNKTNRLLVFLEVKV